MIEVLKVLVHSVQYKLTAKLTELVGWSMTATGVILTGMSFIEIFNGILQSIALIVTIIGGIATYRYVKKKERALPKNNTDHGNE